jgi:hypothetical protein
MMSPDARGITGFYCNSLAPSIQMFSWDLKALCCSVVGYTYHICILGKAYEDIQEEMEVSEVSSLIKVSVKNSCELCADVLNSSRR